MRCLTAILVLFLLAGSVTDRRLPAPAPDSPGGARVDRHVDAHVPAREGEPASMPDDRAERRSAPDPALGTGILQAPSSSPAIQLYRDPLYRYRRY
jgi:hypothetical protein